MPSLQRANYFYNVVNQNRTQAAAPAPLHRSGAACFNRSVLISTPRNDFRDSNYSLDLESNTILTAVHGARC